MLVCMYVCTYAYMYLCSACMHACISVCTYICMFICYVDRPVVEIKTATAGCEYVSVSWTATGNNDVCSPVQYNVTLSSSTIETVLITSMNTHNFTELPDDTQFTVTVISINMMGVASDPVSTAVTTNENCESMCVTPFKLYVCVPHHHKLLIKFIFCCIFDLAKESLHSHYLFLQFRHFEKYQVLICVCTGYIKSWTLSSLL